MPPKKGENPEKQQQHQGGDDGEAAEPSRAVLALHPSGHAAVAVGREVRAWDARSGQLHVLMDASAEGATEVRTVAFSRCGRFVAAGGDDKMARVWRADGDWALLLSFRAPKKINLVNFSADGNAVFAANKFGDVLVAATEAVPDDGPAPFNVLLGHYCSVLTSLSLSSDGRLLATTDRDAKLRVSVIPATGAAATRGAPVIQSYCLGHTDFVSCSAFVRCGDKELVVSGSGDGTLRLWDPMSGRQLGASLVLAPDGQKRAVLAVCPSQDGATLVVAMDEEAEVRLVGVDAAEGALTEVGRTAVPGLPLVTDVTHDSDGKFVFVGGPLPEKPEAVLLAAAELKDGTLVAAVCGAVGDDAARRQLQRCDEGEVGEVVPRRTLPLYLHKRPFVNYEDRKQRKRVRTKGEGEGAGDDTAAAQS